MTKKRIVLTVIVSIIVVGMLIWFRIMPTIPPSKYVKGYASNGYIDGSVSGSAVSQGAAVESMKED